MSRKRRPAPSESASDSQSAGLQEAKVIVPEEELAAPVAPAGSIRVLGRDVPRPVLIRAAQVAGGGLAVLLLSLIVVTTVYRGFLRQWGPHIAGDTRSYSYYAAWVYSGHEYGPPVSDMYHFRTWGYPWVLWQVIEKHQPPPETVTEHDHLEWTANKEFYRGLIRRQILFAMLLPVAAYILAFLLSGRVLLALPVGIYLCFFADPILYGRWVLPDSSTAVLMMICLALVGVGVFLPRWWMTLVAAIPAGLLIGFLTMLRPNFQIIVPVLWIAGVLTALGMLVFARRRLDWWLRLGVLLLGVTLPYAMVGQLSLGAKKEYAGITMLSDGLARMGIVEAVDVYRELPESELTEDERRVRDHILALPPPPADPREGWPQMFNYMNRHALALDMTPDHFRVVLKDLNVKAISHSPRRWWLGKMLPTWQKENAGWMIGGEIIRDREGLAKHWIGRLFLKRQELVGYRSFAISPTTLLVLCTIVCMIQWRRDWRRVFLVMALAGTHLGSLVPGSLMGIPADGRYRYLTEAAASVVIWLGAVIIALWLWRQLRALASEGLARARSEWRRSPANHSSTAPSA